jgi:hypothetical protein
MLNYPEQVRFGYTEPDDAPFEPNLTCQSVDAHGDECPGVLSLTPTYVDVDDDPVYVCPVCGREHTADEVWG